MEIPLRGVGAQERCGRELNLILQQGFEARLRRFVPGSTRRFTSNRGPSSCGSWRESCCNPHLCFPPSVLFCGGALCSRNSIPSTLCTIGPLATEPAPFTLPPPRHLVDRSSDGGRVRVGVRTAPSFRSFRSRLRSGRDLSGRRAGAHSWRLLPGLVRISPVAREGSVRPPNPASLRPGKRPDRLNAIRTNKSG